MREFFRGWKRKVGVVTLVMACAFAAGWMRSFMSNDKIVIHSERFGTHLFTSEIGSIVWCPAEQPDPDCPTIAYYHSLNRVAPTWANLNFVVRRGHGEMVLVKRVLRFQSVAVWYGLFVLPLTLLCAWLLLSKQPPVKAKDQP